MKIEMGESLLYSWLRHVKQCQIVQMNWKASSSWPTYNDELVDQVIASVREHFKDAAQDDIFKDISTQQFFRQAEVDVLGLSYDGHKKKIYGVEVSFHESGLRYGGHKTTIAKVINKCVRIAVVF